MTETDKQFLSLMKGLVSNDKTTREKSLESTKDYLKTLNKSDSNGTQTDLEQIYSKIWKIYWNTDKPVYQRQIAEKVSKLFIDSNTNETDYPLWIKTFLTEFLKKWTQIDFLRMDKYIMLVETIIKYYLEYNLSHKNFANVTNYFGLIESCVSSGFYNYSFISVILKLFIYIVDDLFVDKKDSEIRKEFLENYLITILDKLIKIFITVKDKREIATFSEIFRKIAAKACELDENVEEENVIKLDNNLKDSLMKKFFQVAKSKEDFQENKRKIFYKLYKRMKYNRDEEDKEDSDQSTQVSVDPVNSYILNKNYTNKFKKSKLERMRAMIERQKNQKRIEKILKEKEEEKTKETEKLFEEKLKEMINDLDLAQEADGEEMVKVDEEEEVKEEVVKASDDQEEVESSQGEEEEGEEVEDDDDVYEDDDLEMEYEEEEDDDLEECELGPDSWFLGLDSDDEPTEEDQTLFEAYKNSQKNCEILKPIKEKKEFLNKKRNLERNDNDNLKATNGSNTAIDKKEKVAVANGDRRKNSITSNSSRDGNQKKKKVTFKFARNEFNEYDNQKPINLSSHSKKQNQSKDRTQLKGLLKCRNRNRK